MYPFTSVMIETMLIFYPAVKWSQKMNTFSTFIYHIEMNVQCWNENGDGEKSPSKYV